jgi:hypothetical protein
MVQIEVEQQEIEMTQDNSNSGKSALYWITLGIIFAAFFMLAAS